MKKNFRNPKIVPHIWFEDQGIEAAKVYLEVFPDSEILSDVVLDGTPSGSVTVVNLRLADLRFQFLNAGPLFERNPSISYMVACRSVDEVDRLWTGLSDGAEILMPLDAYEFSNRYGWLKDRFGVSWQLILTTESGLQKITPAFLFVNEVYGKAEAAMNGLMSLFPDSGLVGQSAAHMDDNAEGGKKVLDYARFSLAGQEIVFMDSGFEHQFSFNEMQSLIVECEDQEELDFYWNALSYDKSAEQCGWLKDKYGISWQIVPNAMERMMREGNKAQLTAVTGAFLKMKKFNIAALEDAFVKGRNVTSEASSREDPR